MAINSISSDPALSSPIQAVTPSAPPSPSALPAPTATAGVTVEISKLGQLRSDLTSLAQSDPARFKAVTADIAQKLKDAASNDTGSRPNFLTKLADRFDSASQSGDASDLSPATGRARGHHHHGGRHRGHGGGFGVSGGEAGESVADVVRGIVSGALGSVSGTTPAATPAPATTTT